MRDSGDGPVVEARGLVKRYESGDDYLEALKGVDLDIEPGEFVAIMGPSGSGKSTLLNMLGLLDEPTEGTVHLDGQDTSTMSDRQLTTARKRTIGFVFQNFYLIPTLTALENVEVPAMLDRDPETRPRHRTAGSRGVRAHHAGGRRRRRGDPRPPGSRFHRPDGHHHRRDARTMSPLEDFYRQFPTALIARRNLSRTTARTVLAMLGIVIGVVAIASLGVFGSVLQTAAVGSLGDIGNQLIVSPNAEEGFRELSDRDVRAIERAAGDASVVPLKQQQATVTYGGQTTFTTAYGIANPADAYTASQGRIPDPLRNGALVGANLAGSNLADRLDLREGNSITVDNRTYRVRAVLEQQTGISLVNVGGAVVLPPTAINQTGYQQVIVQAETGEQANETARAIREDLNGREERVTIFELSQLTDQIGSFFDTLSLFLIGIGSISLVVAGVSILNVMLMSTIERRGEIGVLRAVGYQRLDVLKILLTEAMLLGLVGGLVGVALSVGAGAAIAHFALGDPMQALQPGNVVYYVAGLAFGVLTSVVSGLYPAWKAAKERPVDALRG